LTAFPDPLTAWRPYTLRFVFLTQYFPPEIGAPQTRLHSMASQLLDLGHEVEVVTALPNYPRGKFFAGYGGRFYVRERHGGITVHRVWIYPALGGGVRRILNYLSFAFTCLFGLLQCRKPDYLLVESPPLTSGIPAFLASRLWKIPFIFNVADLWPDAIVDSGLREGSAVRALRRLESWCYEKAARVNAVTDGIRSDLISRKGVPGKKVLYLPNGADTAHFCPSPPDLELKAVLGLANKRIILWAGSLGQAHGLEFVIQAARLLAGDPSIHFVFLGDGSSRKALEQLAASLALTNVTFLEPVSLERLPRYFSIAECGLASLRAAPTHEGARPSKIFPVLASGKALVFIGAGECARLVRESRSGVVIAPENAAAIAAEISALLYDRDRLREYGANGRSFVERHFDWSALVRSWLAQLDESSPESLTSGAPIGKAAHNEAFKPL